MHPGAAKGGGTKDNTYRNSTGGNATGRKYD